MEILDKIIWDMTLEPNQAIMWDEKKKDYKKLSINDFNTKIGTTIILKCPLNLSTSVIILNISHKNTLGEIMLKIHNIYSNIQVINDMDGMTWFNGISEIDYPNYVLNVSK